MEVKNIMADVTAAAAMKAQPKEETSRAFKWFHATSVNGGAMAIAATISSYYSIFVQENLGLQRPPSPSSC